MSSQVVMSLMKPLFEKGYCVTTDNFYTSPELAETLIARSCDTYGTVCGNRKGMPPQIKNKKLKKGEVAAYQKGKMMVLRWKDKKEVTLLSTVHNSEMQTVEKRGISVRKPKIVVDYNDTMGGVDRVDQHLADYPIPRKRGINIIKNCFSISWNCAYGICTYFIEKLGEINHTSQT